MDSLELCQEAGRRPPAAVAWAPGPLAWGPGIPEIFPSCRAAPLCLALCVLIPGSHCPALAALRPVPLSLAHVALLWVQALCPGCVVVRLEAWFLEGKLQPNTC